MISSCVIFGPNQVITISCCFGAACVRGVLGHATVVCARSVLGHDRLGTGDASQRPDGPQGCPAGVSRRMETGSVVGGR